MVNNSAQLDILFGALADETRRGIIGMLTSGEKTINELAQPFAISLPAVLKHLKILERAQIVSRKKVGRVNHVSLSPDAMKEATQWIQHHEKQWNARFDALERMLDEES